MTTKVVFTVELEPQLRAAFMAEAEANDQPAAQVVCELMHNYVEQSRRACRAREEYDAYLRRKVETAYTDIANGHSFSDEDIEAEFSAARDELLRQAEA